MSRIKSAPEKKAESYKRDHVFVAEYPKAFRKAWPRKKTKANREVRHKVRQELRTVANVEETIEAEVADVRRKEVRKWSESFVPLIDHVSERLQHRRDMVNARTKRQFKRQA